MGPSGPGADMGLPLTGQEGSVEMNRGLVSMVLAALVCALSLLLAVALWTFGEFRVANAQEPAAGGVDGPSPSGTYSVEQSAVSGDGYQLTTLSWRVSGAASGGEYVLFGPAAPRLVGSGCCCTYLPLMLR